MFSTIRRPAVVAASCAAATVLAVGSGYAVGASTSAKVIKACATKSTGGLRVTSGHCKPSERSVSWSVAGPRGRQGVKGKPGTPGPSVGYFDDNSSGAALLDSGGVPLGYVTVDSITLPAGSYLLNANTNVYVVGAANSVQCGLYTPLQQDVPTLHIGLGVAAEFPAEGAVTLIAPATVSYECDANSSATAGDQVYAGTGSLQAVAVGTLHASSEL